MKNTVRWLILALLLAWCGNQLVCAQDAATAQSGSKPLRVAIFKDRGALAVDEIIRTLKENGMEAETIGLRSFDRLFEFDAIFFGGGWNRFNWLPFDERAKLVEFVENRGGGAIFSMFRCGTAARGMIRPIFPEVAYAYGKSNGSDILIRKTDHPITQGLPERYITPYWDHAVLKVGLLGDVLAVNSNDDASLVCGQVGMGRVVFIGPWIGLHGQYTMVAYPLPETDQKLLLNSIRWATGAPHRAIGGKPEVSEAVLMKVLRREKIIDWTHDDHGVSWTAGILPRAMYPSEEKLDSLVFRLQKMTPYAETPSEMMSILDLRNRVAVALDELRGSYEQAVENKKREIGAMTPGELQEVVIQDMRGRGKDNGVVQEQVELWQESFCPQHTLDQLDREVTRLEQELDIDKRIEDGLRAEREADLADIDQYLAMAGSKDLKTRMHGVEELARIGGDKAEKALVKALGDPDQKVRLTAIKGLAWMQSSAAVNPLVEIVRKSDDQWMRRRAVQALGQIGDGQAFDVLLEAFKDDDVFVRRNAILSLGWIGNPKAAPHLLKVLKNPMLGDKVREDGRKQVREHSYVSGKDLPYSATDIACAVRALGHLGDKSAVAPVEEFFKTHYLVSSRIPTDYLLETFKSEIDAGGRKVKGIPQSADLANRGYCFPFGSRYSGLYGRYDLWGNRPRDLEVWADYATGIGGNGHINFTTPHELSVEPPAGDDKKSVKARTRYEKKRFDEIYATQRYYDRVDFKQYYEIPNKMHMVFDLAAMEDTMMNWGQEHRSFAGYWQEESLHYCAVLSLTDADKEFQAYLKEKYSPAELKELGIADLDQVAIPEADGKGRRYTFEGSRSKKVVFAEYLEFLSDRGIEYWREGGDWIREFRKGATLNYSLSQRYAKGAGLIGAYPLSGEFVFDCYGPQSYGAHSMRNNFDLEMHSDGEQRPVMGEFYAHQTGNPGRIERGIASSFIHGQCYFNWWWGQVFKHPPGGNGGCSVWDKGRWAAFVRQFHKGREISEYVAPRDTETVGTVGQIYSGRSSALTYGRGAIDSFGGFTSGGRQFRYTQNQEGVWQALMESHLSVDMTWMETRTPERLKRYSVIVLSDAWCLTDREAEMLRNWVKAGGVLIASGGTTLHDGWDRPLKDYALADVFGVKHESNQVEGGIKDMFTYIERAVKPEDGIVTIELKDPDYVKHAEGAPVSEYHKADGYDTIKPTTAKVVGVWQDGSPAVTENKFGKGACIFLAPVYPGLSCRTVGWTVDQLYNEYWRGSRELLAACVRRGLELTDTALPLEVENCPVTVETVLRNQPWNNRLVAHFLDIDPNRELVSGIEAAVTIPEGRKVKAVYYPYPGREDVDYESADGKIKFKVREFAVHELAVIELE